MRKNKILNSKESISKIIEYVGGKENIQSATHCVTRLRLILKDTSKANISKLEDIDIVKGCFNAGGQFQIVIGTGVDKVYKDLIDQTGAEEVSKEEIKQQVNEKSNKFQKFIRILADIFIPILPAIVASGLLMGVNNMIANPGIFYEKSVIEVNTDIAGISGIINLIANTSFTFLPALIGWSAAKKFGGNPLLGVVLGLVLVHPALMSAYDFAANPSAAPTWDIFGMKVAQVGYQGQVIPVLIATYILAKLELFLKKTVPDAVQLVLVSPIALLITGMLTFVVIGPITMTGANMITNGVVYLFEVAPVFAGALYSFISPPLVITGMHHLFLGVNLQMAGTLGYVTLWPISETVTLAQGAATLAMFFILKNNKNLRGVSITSTISAWLGITEPAIYGINLRFRYPFIAVMVASAIGGAFTSYHNVKATAVGVGGVFSFLSVMPQYWGVYFTGMAITFVITIGLTYLFYKSGKFKTNDNI
ncbi:PTS trehalose transporter subunit IIBC [Clostridioides difficile]|uniref:PTS trehalose transporter subunit IIBC n=1 Tax=Clostridioides difficile TaxID=1496 RepID=UPI0033059E60